MAKAATITKQADSKGRVTLGPAYANKLLLIENREDKVVIRVGCAIPESEVWLYKNDQALSSLRRGLEQARRGEFVEGPNLQPVRKRPAKRKTR